MDVRLPDGTIVRNVPEGTTRSQLMARMGKAAPSTKPDAAASFAYGLADGATFGFLDEAGAALDSLIPGKGHKNVWSGSSFSDAYGANVANNRARLKAGAEAHPVANAVGQVASIAIPAGGAAKLPGLARGMMMGGRGAKVAGRIAADAAGGALYGAGSSQGSLADRAAGALEGGALGAATGAAFRSVARAASPVVNPTIRKLQQAGVPLTVGQIAGGTTKAIEDKLTSVPILGDLIKMQQRKGIEALQRSAIDEALAPIGSKLPKDVATGRQAIDWAQSRASEAYDDALLPLHIQPDEQFAAGMGDVRAGVGGLAPEQVDDFDRIMRREVAPFSGPSIDGHGLQDIKQGLDRYITRYRSGSPREQEVADALEGVRDEFMSLADRQSPELTQSFRDANAAYRNMVSVNKAAAKTADGTFSAPQFSSAVREADRSKNKRAFAAGNAPMQELSDAAAQTLPSSVPDSGTIGRGIVGGILGSAGGASAIMGNPVPLMAGAALSAPYLPGGRQTAEWLLTGRQGPLAKKARRMFGGAALPASYAIPLLLGTGE